MSLASNDFIKLIVDEFYLKARTDILIGYHFNHIKDFNHHLERIYAFWNMHLLKIAPPFNYRLMMTHLPLGIKTGEINRWVKLFIETIEENKHRIEDQNFCVDWLEKIEMFRNLFLTHPALARQT
jgi:truncated hemoglobin YjbI